MGRWSGAVMAVTAVTVGLALFAGCDSKEEEKKGAKHEHKAPHGGALVEFGEEFAHLEVVVDAATGQVTGYVLDGEAEKPVRIEQRELAIEVKGKSSALKVTLKAVVNPLTGEKSGDTSQFEGQADGLRGLKEFDATVVKITVKGKDFSGVDFNFPKGNETK